MKHLYPLLAALLIVAAPLKAQDIGLELATTHRQPMQGHMVYPVVEIHNYGDTAMCDIPLQYAVEGWQGVTAETKRGCVQPGESFVYRFATPLAIPMGTTQITLCVATTIDDIEPTNNMVCQPLTVLPNDDDLSAVELLAPRHLEIAGDTLAPTVRICNEGTYPIGSATVAINYNNEYNDSEEANFVQLLGSEGLLGGQCINYTCHHNYPITIGYTTISITVTTPLDIDHTNDTIRTLFQSATDAIDLAAIELVPDSSNSDGCRYFIGIRNAGSQAVNDFELMLSASGHTFTQRLAEFTIPPLQTRYVPIDTLLPYQAGGYADMRAAVTAQNDLDRTNDTTATIARPYIDISVLKIYIQDNQDTACAVRVRLQNLGNTTLREPYWLVVNINGHTLSSEMTTPLEPGRTTDVQLPTLLTKDPERQYVGDAMFYYSFDANHANNQTSTIEVVNLFLGIEQTTSLIANTHLYPNPATDHTNLELTTTEPTPITISLLDLRGKLLYSHHSTSTNEVVLPIDLYHYPKGIYLLRIATPTEVKTIRVVKQ